MFTVYILYSEKHGKTYVGFTSNLIERFKSHNALQLKVIPLNLDLGK
jgi:putative endonuclease